MDIVTGQTYMITHCRKGTFVVYVTTQDDTWVNGVIRAGNANAILPENEKYVGDGITLRKSFISRATMQSE